MNPSSSRVSIADGLFQSVCWVRGRTARCYHTISRILLTSGCGCCRTALRVSFGARAIRSAMMLYVLPPPAAAGPPSPWSTILCDDARPSSVRGSDGGQQEPVVANGGRLTYKRNASNNRRVKAWLNAVQKNNRPPPPRKPSVDAAGPEVRSKF